MWWYLESNFTKEDALNNPYGPGQYGAAEDAATNEMPIKCPAFEFLTPEQEALENVDTQDEKDFGEKKRKERILILQSDMAPVVTGPKRSSKKGMFFLRICQRLVRSCGLMGVPTRSCRLQLRVLEVYPLVVLLYLYFEGSLLTIS